MLEYSIFLLLVCQFSFIIGFLLGKSVKSDGTITAASTAKDDLDDFRYDKFRKTIIPKNRITIDEKKFVTDISTDKFKKLGSELGKDSQVDDDLSSSVSKLSQLKKKTYL